ncbi:HesB/IscA family protein [Planctobacterium marinum]|uniref:HesB/IscA family protein n=1 Tax=Planctobacterium marinum TaxID=1631968 RepID=UPI001E2A90BF|nr:iron-sulfur cluster assembly accessory protein [Planctobacterium marinum]MCC2603878.1 iron-sulfur cluster assembly accessory protein [Planctobacterium marinum]
MTVNTFDPTASLVTVTDSAKAHFAKMLGNNQDKMIRLSTKVSGCSGYAYVLDAVDAKKDNDLEITLDNGLLLLIAADAAPLVQDTEIDYVKVGINGEIRFNNPNVVSECGCGESFNVG